MWKLLWVGGSGNPTLKLSAPTEYIGLTLDTHQLDPELNQAFRKIMECLKSYNASRNCNMQVSFFVEIMYVLQNYLAKLDDATNGKRDQPQYKSVLLKGNIAKGHKRKTVNGQREDAQLHKKGNMCNKKQQRQWGYHKGDTPCEC